MAMMHGTYSDFSSGLMAGSSRTRRWRLRVVIDGELVVISGDAGSFLVIPSSSTYFEIFIFMQISNGG